MTVQMYIVGAIVGQAAFAAICGAALLVLAAVLKVWPSKLLQTQMHRAGRQISANPDPDKLEVSADQGYATLGKWPSGTSPRPRQFLWDGKRSLTCEIENLSVRNAGGPLTAVALALAAILDDPQHVATQPAAARQLVGILSTLSKRTEHRGKLAMVKSMTTSSPPA